MTDLRFEITFEEASGDVARIVPVVDHHYPWGSDGVVDHARNLLIYLAHKWHHLLLEQTYPANLRPLWPSQLRIQLAQALDDELLTDEDANKLSNTVFAFQQRHNIASAFSGIDLPHLFLLRQGDEMLVEGSDVRRLVSIGEAARALQVAGKQIADRLRTDTREMMQKIVASWDSREELSSERFELALRASTSMAPDALAIVRAQIAEVVRSGFQQFFADNSVLAAARMSGNLEPSEIKSVVEMVSRSTRRRSRELDELSDHATRYLGHFRTKRPFEQGEELALWFRRQRRLTDDKNFDIEGMLHELRIPVHTCDLESEFVEAIAIMEGGEVAILLNRRGSRNATTGGKRASLAHELCHLLVDRFGALPMVEVLGGRPPVAAERRANAFAAGLLLPKSAAGIAWDTTRNLQIALAELANQYGVTHSVAAQQMLYSRKQFLSPSTVSKLRQISRYGRASHESPFED